MVDPAVAVDGHRWGVVVPVAFVVYVLCSLNRTRVEVLNEVSVFASRYIIIPGTGFLMCEII